jgi:hypothetical protein
MISFGSTVQSAHYFVDSTSCIYNDEQIESLSSLVPM